MAHSLRAAAVASGLAFAVLAVRCEPKTFDLLPESDGGSSGKAPTGGNANFNSGGINTSGGNSGNSGSGGYGTGGKGLGGQISGGAPSTGGFSAFTGGRAGQAPGGAAGKSGNFIAPGCAAFCGGSGCTPCSEATPDVCWPGVCNLDCATDPSVKVGVCVQCVKSRDCMGDLTNCDAATKTCTQDCSNDAECTLTTRHVCEGGGCVECRNNTDCTPALCNTVRHVCVQCLNDGDCGARKCAREWGICVECWNNSDCGQNSWCERGVCSCNEHTQCMNAPVGPSCLVGRCQRCSLQLPCDAGETCQSDGRCTR